MTLISFLCDNFCNPLLGTGHDTERGKKGRCRELDSDRVRDRENEALGEDGMNVHLYTYIRAYTHINGKNIRRICILCLYIYMYMYAECVSENRLECFSNVCESHLTMVAAVLLTSVGSI